MTATTDMYALLRAFVEELARCGMRAACTSPGSRSAPLVLSLANESRLHCYSHVDERCSGFFALGLAKASGRPVAVTCTSGTAAAELLPAAIEAREARVPLLLLTADRPAELRENGAGQAIDQLKLFGGAAKWFAEVSVHEAGAEQLRWMRTLACRAYWTALEGRPGAVHLNFPLREPLVGELELPADPTGRADGAPYVTRSLPRPTPDAQGVSELAGVIAGARRGVLVAGRDERGRGVGEAASVFAASAGWALLADPMSRARRGQAAIAHYDALLRDEAFAAAMSPDVVLRVGDLPVSKPLRTWLSGLTDARQIAFDPEGAWQDPASVLSASLALDPAAALGALAGSMRATAGVEAPDGVEAPAGVETPAGMEAPDEDWLSGWRSADELASEAIAGVVAREELSEPAVAGELGVLLPEQATLFVASSMPVRDIETVWPAREGPPRVLCNRGANGIDGTVSSALGVAADGGGPVVLLIGDVALAYDIGGLLAASRDALKLTIVLLDNGGGGIFDFLAVSRASMARAHETSASTDIYTRHVATPTGLDFARAAALYGFAHAPVRTRAELRGALERALKANSGSTLIHVQTDRPANVALHARMWHAVAQALARGREASAG
jgi:2-succinyl-5-enolpyruvyl-6-hydroxy-3-cyclohexene-1-carboxylate synthase